MPNESIPDDGRVADLARLVEATVKEHETATLTPVGHNQVTVPVFVSFSDAGKAALGGLIFACNPSTLHNLVALAQEQQVNAQQAGDAGGLATWQLVERMVMMRQAYKESLQ